MSTEHDRSAHRSVNAEVPVNDPDFSTGDLEGQPIDSRRESMHADEPAHTGIDREEGTPLLDQHDLDRFRTQWQELQGAFVDDPKEAVTKADSLVSETLEQLTTTFAQRKKKLDEQWSRGEDGDTEDLRHALRGYRDYFDRLLTI
ncbi:hypothetical protein [Nocardia heshunensis]